MTRFFLSATVAVIFMGNLACQSGSTPVAESNSANAVTNVAPQNIPPEFSTVPITPSGNSTPGIPDPKAVNITPAKGGAPIPGIPANPGKPLVKGPTPIPGIPDEATLKKQMNGSLVNANAARPAANSAANKPSTERKF